MRFNKNHLISFWIGFERMALGLSFSMMIAYIISFAVSYKQVMNGEQTTAAIWMFIVILAIGIIGALRPYQRFSK